MHTEERLHALDAVREFALIAGAVLHATMSFLPGIGAQGWPITDNSPSVALGCAVKRTVSPIMKLTRG